MPSEAIIQRDGSTFAIVTRTPGGIVTAEDLARLAAIVQKYRVPTVKLTSGQRFLLAGIPEKNLPAIWKDLGMDPRRSAAPCVKFVHACVGTDMCRYANQDSLALGKAIEERFIGQTFPAKIKIGVSGCPRCCGESRLRDIGIMGTNRGWTVVFGGNGGRDPRIGDEIARNLADGEVLDLIQRLLEYYRANAGRGERTARFMERTGFDRLRSDLLRFVPYIPLEETGPS